MEIGKAMNFIIQKELKLNWSTQTNQYNTSVNSIGIGFAGRIENLNICLGFVVENGIKLDYSHQYNRFD